MLNVSGMFFMAGGVSYLKNGKGREIPVTPHERELHWCYYSPSIFLASSQTATRTQSSFDTHATWQPVTSARSRRSYGKIEDCEQSSWVRSGISKQFDEKIGDCEHWLHKLPNSSHCGFKTKVLESEKGK